MSRTLGINSASLDDITGGRVGQSIGAYGLAVDGCGSRNAKACDPACFGSESGSRGGA